MTSRTLWIAAMAWRGNLFSLARNSPSSATPDYPSPFAPQCRLRKSDSAGVGSWTSDASGYMGPRTARSVSGADSGEHCITRRSSDQSVGEERSRGHRGNHQHCVQSASRCRLKWRAQREYRYHARPISRATSVANRGPSRFTSPQACTATTASSAGRRIVRTL